MGWLCQSLYLEALYFRAQAQKLDFLGLNPDCVTDQPYDLGHRCKMGHNNSINLTGCREY